MKNDSMEYEKELKETTKLVLSDHLQELDFFKDIKYIEPNFKQYHHSKRFNGKRLLIAVASLMILLLTSSSLAMCISNGSVIASKFKLEQQLVKLKNGILGTDEILQKTIDNDSIILNLKNLDEIDKAENFFPGLFVPEKIPERFQFESLSITKTTGDLYRSIYTYTDVDGALLTISQESVPTDGFSVCLINITKEIKTSTGTIYICDNPFGDGTNSISYLTESFIIDIAGKIEIEEALRIINE